MIVDILSDLHIQSEEDPTYRSLLDFLKLPRPGQSTIVFAGDLFDVWVGAKSSFQKRYSDFFREIQNLHSHQVSIFFLQGNHDFGFKSLFHSYSNVAVKNNSLLLNSDGKEVDLPVPHSHSLFVDHGDLVQSDWSYRLLRYLFRSPIFLSMVAASPQSWIDFVGSLMSRYSLDKHPQLPETWEAEQLQKLRDDYRSFAKIKWTAGINAVVLGHCHDKDEYSERQQSQVYCYMNVGFPRVHRTFIRWNSQSGKLERMPF